MLVSFTIKYYNLYNRYTVNRGFLKMKEEFLQDMMTISQFSKLTGISRKLLIYYDNSGVFSPEYTAPNGYRYYSYGQIHSIFVIVVLKELGLSLKEVKEYIRSYSPDDEILFLQKQDEVLSKKIRQLESTRDMLRSRLKRAETALETGRKELTVSYEEETPLFISDPLPLLKKDEVPFEVWNDFDKKCKDAGISNGYSDGYIIDKESLAEKCTDRVRYLAFYVEDPAFSNAVFPAGTYQTAFCRGSFNNLNTKPVYRKMLKYVEDHNLEIAGNAYEERLLDEVSAKDKDLQLLRIRLQIRYKKI